MAITKKTENKDKTTYNIKVLRAKEFGESISFDMEVNGITIYGCWYRAGKKKDGSDYSMVSFPSHKGNDGKYYNYAWFTISKEMIVDIEKMIEEVL